MPKFKVCMTRMVEILADVDVDATTAEEARQKALDTDPGITAEWREGDDCTGIRVWTILDEAGVQVWEA